MRKHHINTIKSVAAYYAGISYRSIRNFHVIDSEELEDGSMIYLVRYYSDETIAKFVKNTVRLAA